MNQTPEDADQRRAVDSAEPDQDEVFDDVNLPEDDGLPRPNRQGHAKMPERLDDDALERAVERERADAGITDYAQADVPPATDPLPEGSSQAADLAQRGLTDEQAG
ncbi:hypothetical protein [Terrabacter sp. NPDC080008]|uniref:hypothetical protein n=1 Tax=Terrabacter sp. NPDC080008 TaxID=3155176 RepID=UPI00345041B5